MKKIILILLCAAGVFAQQTKKDSVVYNLDAVTVTATRYAEKVIEVPYAVSILKGVNQNAIKGYGIEEALQTIPGVVVQSRAGAQDVRLTIRGYGARGAGDRSNSGTSRGVRVMTDGIPETEPDGRTSLDMLDMSLIDQAEVICSNASALWGNAAGGVINFRSMPLGLDPFYNFQFSSGSFGFNKYVARAYQKAGDAKIYFGFANNSSDGYRKHSQAKRSVAMISLLTEIAPLSTLGVFISGSSSLFHIPGPLTQAQYDADPEQANATYAARDERRYNRMGRIGATLDYMFNEHRQISAMAFVNPKYLQRSERGTFRDFNRYHIGGNLVYKEILQFGENKNTLSVGVDEAYQDGAILFYNLSATNGRGTTLRDNKREGANTFGAFVQNELTLDEKLSVLLGARLDKVSYFSESFINPKLIGVQERVFEKVTPKAGVSYRFNPEFSVYANLGGGVEVPAGNETDPAGTFGQDTVYLLNPLLDPIKSTSVEAGVKHILRYANGNFVKGFSYEAAVYSISVSNDIIPYQGGKFYFTAGKTSRTGFELCFETAMQYGLTLNGSLNIVGAKYDDYKIDSVHYNKAKAGIYASYNGNKAAGIPASGFSLGLGYTPSYASFLRASVNVQNLGKYYADDANKYEVPAYTIINAALSTPEAIKIGAGLGIKCAFAAQNLTGAKYAASAFINPDLVSNVPVFLEPGLPANYLFTVQLAY